MSFAWNKDNLEYGLGTLSDLPPDSDVSTLSKAESEPFTENSQNTLTTASIKVGEGEGKHGTSEITETNPRQSSVNFDVSKLGNYSTMIDMQLPPSSDTTFDSRILKSSIRSTVASASVPTILRDDMIIIEQKKGSTKKKVSFVQQPLPQRDDPTESHSDDKKSVSFDDMFQMDDGVLDDLLRKSRRNISKDSDNLKDDNAPKDKIINEHYEKEVTSIKIAYFIIVLIYLLVTACSVLIVCHVWAITMNNTHDSIDSSSEKDITYIKHLFQFLGTRRYNRHYIET